MTEKRKGESDWMKGEEERWLGAVSEGPARSPLGTQVFVYGTLMPGECNHDRYCGGTVLNQQPAMVVGRLFELLARGYPALMAGDRPVYGVLLTFANAEVLTDLDELEDFQPDRAPEQNEYIRLQTEVFDRQGRAIGVAWVYQMRPEKVQELQGVEIASGRWGRYEHWQEPLR